MLNDPSAASLRLGDRLLPVKAYACADETGCYISLNEPKLWLYINVTDACPAACPFCVNPPSDPARAEHLDPDRLRATLLRIRQHVSGVSITGGEPMLHTGLIRRIVQLVTELTPAETELDLVTNGAYLEKLPTLTGIRHFSTIHISRHAVSDDANRALMGFDAPTLDQIRSCMQRLPDPGAITFNCVLQKGGVEDLSGAADYLEMAAELNAANTSFISMIRVNDYCREHFVAPDSIHFCEDPRFQIWNAYHDYDHCRCTSGDFLARTGRPVRFYCRYPGTPCTAYVRQLVYDTDNTLRAGFQGPVIECSSPPAL